MPTDPECERHTYLMADSHCTCTTEPSIAVLVECLSKIEQRTFTRQEIMDGLWETYQMAVDAQRSKDPSFSRWPDMEAILKHIDTHGFPPKTLLSPVEAEIIAFIATCIKEPLAQAEMRKEHYAGAPEGRLDEAFWRGQAIAFAQCLDLVHSHIPPAEFTKSEEEEYAEAGKTED